MSLKLFITGDYHIYGKFDRYIKRNPDHALFSESLVGLVGEHDIKIFNLEDPITQSRKGCIKSGPFGVGSKESLFPIRKAGFNYATFATNHTYDMKDIGIRDTLQACNDAGIEVFGAGMNPKQASQAMRIAQNDVSVSILNYARKEFNLANNYHGGANPFDLIDAYHEITREQNRSDFVIVIIHEGMDVYDLPTPGLLKKIRFLSQAKPDMIVLHHSQKVSGYEKHNGVPIFYGLGNLLHLSPNDFDRYGLTLSIELDKTLGLSYRIFPIKLDPSTIVIHLLEGRENERVMSNIDRLSKIIGNPKELELQWKLFTKRKKLAYISPLIGLNPYAYRLLKRLSFLGILERISWIKKRRLLAVLNIMRCSVHREATIDILEELFHDER